MEKEPSNQVLVPKSIMRKIKVYAAHNDMKLKEVISLALNEFISRNDGSKSLVEQKYEDDHKWVVF